MPVPCGRPTHSFQLPPTPNTKAPQNTAGATRNKHTPKRAARTTATLCDVSFRQTARHVRIQIDAWAP
eukprot:6376051-Alexandrium_andersonii.AAC.1